MASASILHIDMDAFFASVEQLDNPALRGKCVVVGGASNRGVVAAASYEARRFGIHSAMPIFQARQKCAALIIVPPRRKRYAELSQRIMSFLETFSPLVEPVSIDEAYLDVGGCLRLRGTPLEIARAIKSGIRDQVRLTCSVGAAPNKFLAKIASDLNKPDGLTVIEPEQAAAFIDALPIQKVPGVGQRAHEQLTALGIRMLGQIRDLPADLLIRRMGKFGHRLLDLAQGRDDSPVAPHGAAKSMSSETTLDHDTRDRDELEMIVLAQSQSVARQLRRHEMAARTITLKIKTADFQRHTRSQTLTCPTQASEAVFQAARDLLRAFNLNLPVRLIGVGASGLQAAQTPVQASLFPEPGEDRQRKWAQVDRVVDAISERYGGTAVLRGALTSTDQRRKP